MNHSNGEETIFAEALRLPPEQRAAYVEEVTHGNTALHQRVQSLLQNYEAGSFLEQSAAPSLRETITASLSVTEKPGDRIGRYKLLQQIGEGGCGIVYMAEQEEPVRRRVALKIIKLGMDTKSVIARFEAERQALALMDHPNIAKVFDAGATETGRPFFVMELVRGRKLTDYCDEVKLSIRARLDLFVQVCHAVQHAHQKGIIHRDLKPSNILVTINDGVAVPKVIDFGIAKATGGQQLTDKTLFTAFEQFIGTPAYMSPEQAVLTSVDIDTRSDIYALGVLLYEVLTGKTLFDTKDLLAIGLDAMCRTIREKEPDRPSMRLSTLTGDELSTTAQLRGVGAPKLAGELRGDLDWIVMKCLEKDRTRRYETANALAMDLQRHLDSEPVLAGPPSAAYRLRKFIRRHRTQVAFGMILAGGMVTSVVVLTLSLLEAKRAESRARTAQRAADVERIRAVSESQRADRQAAVARAVSDFLQNDLLKQAGSLEQVNLGFEPKPELTVKEALRRASDKIGERFADRPAVEAEIRETLGISFDALSEWNLAVPQLERAVALLKRTAGTNAPGTLEAMSRLARAYSQAGRVAEAISLAEENLRLTRARLGSDDTQTVDAMENLAVVYKEAGRYADQVSLCEEVLRLTKSKFGSEDRNTLARMNNLALAYHFDGRSDQALALQEEVVKLAKTILGPDHPNTLTGIQNLAMDYQEVGRWAQAIPLLEELLQLHQAKLGPEHQATLRTMHSLAIAYQGAGLLSAALPLQEKTLDLVGKTLGPDHPDTLINMNTLSWDYLQAGRTNEAVALGEEAFSLTKAKLGLEHPNTLSAMNSLAVAFRAAGRLNEAVPLHEQALQVASATLGINHPYTITTLDNLMADYLTAGRSGDAENLFHNNLAPAIANAPQNPGLLRVRANYLARLGQWKDAAQDFKKLTDLNSRNFGDWHYLAMILVQVGDRERYREHCRKVIEHFANASDALTTFRVAKDCLLLPDSGADAAIVDRLIDNALLAGTNTIHWPMFESTKALAEYRQGRFASARDWAGAALAYRIPFPCDCWRPGLQAEAETVLAMAEYRLQQKEVALGALTVAQDLVERKLPGLEVGDLGPNWLDWIVSHALLRETRELMGNVEPKEPGK